MMERTVRKVTTPSEPTRRIEPEDYRRILRGLKLVKLALTDCEVKSDPEAVRKAFEQSRVLSVDIRDVKADFEPSDESTTMRHSYSVTSKDGRKNLLTIKAHYVLTFQTAEPVTADFFEVFRAVSLPTFTWPYLRELVDSMTCRLGLPRLLLPLLHTQ